MSGGISYPRIGVATVRGVEDQVVMRGHGPWLTASEILGSCAYTGSDVADFRPLALIDPEDAGQIARLWKVSDGSLAFHAVQRNLRAYAAKQSDPTPPEPEGDVVVMDRNGNTWARNHRSLWCRPLIGGDRTWEALVRERGPLRVYRAED